MIADVTRVCRVRLRGRRRTAARRLVDTTDRWGVEHCLGPPGLGTWIVKSKRIDAAGAPAPAYVVRLGRIDSRENKGMEAGSRDAERAVEARGAHDRPARDDLAAVGVEGVHRHGGDQG
jgi:hypothetical protein